MVRTAALRLEIDARNMKQGAEEAKKALTGIADESKKTARQITVDTSSIEKKLDAIADGIRESNSLLSSNSKTVTVVMKETETQLGKTTVEQRKFNSELTKASGIAGAVESKFAALGKAAVGMFAADVVAKVLGFSSAMDVLQKTTSTVADSIRTAALDLVGFDKNMRDTENTIESLTERINKLQEQRDANRISLSTKNGPITLGDFGQSRMSIDQQITFYAQIRKAQEEIARIEAGVYQPGRPALLGNSRAFLRGGMPPEDILGRGEPAPTAASVIKELEASLKDLVVQSDRASRAMAGLAPDFERDRSSIMDRYGRPRRYDGINGAFNSINAGRYQVQSRQASRGGDFNVPLPPDYMTDAELAGLSVTGGGNFRYASPAVNFADYRSPAQTRYGGIYDVKNRINAGDYTVPSTFEGRLRDNLSNRYSPEAIANQFASNLYQSMSYSLMSGDFSQFGRSVVNMIGQSLVDNLVAAPFQEAMATLMQSLLSGLRGGLGAGGAVSAGATAYLPTGGGPGAPASIQAGAGSNSVGPYRSNKQRVDDFQRLRLR